MTQRRSLTVFYLLIVITLLSLVFSSAGQASTPKISDLSWMSGDWQTAPGKTQVDEHWTLPAGGTMLGMGRTLAGGKTVFYEYLRIETRPEGIFYVAHPKAKPGTDFKLVALKSQEAVFENKDHDFPKRIIYRRNADGSLTARVEGDASQKAQEEEVLYLPMKK